MKKNLYLLAIAIAIITTVYSCKNNDEGKLPNIAFKTGAGYTSRDTIVTAGDSVKVGIIASKAEENDPLIRFTVAQSWDSSPDTTIYTENLSGALGDNYNKETFIHTRNLTGTHSEKYTFTVINRDGLTNSVSLTLTVH